MASVYYTEQKAWDLYNLGNDYPVSGYGQASAQILSAVGEHGTKGGLDYYVSAWAWVPDPDACPSGRFATISGKYDNVSGTELPFLYPVGTYPVTEVEDGPDTIGKNPVKGIKDGVVEYDTTIELDTPLTGHEASELLGNRDVTEP